MRVGGVTEQSRLSDVIPEERLISGLCVSNQVSAYFALFQLIISLTSSDYYFFKNLQKLPTRYTILTKPQLLLLYSKLPVRPHLYHCTPAQASSHLHVAVFLLPSFLLQPQLPPHLILPKTDLKMPPPQLSLYSAHLAKLLH